MEGEEDSMRPYCHEIVHPHEKNEILEGSDWCFVQCLDNKGAVAHGAGKIAYALGTWHVSHHNQGR